MATVGNKEIIDKLKNLADKRELAQGYLFFGPDGVGRRQVALGLASYLEEGIFDYDKRKSILGDCLLIDSGEENSIGIDQSRDIKRFFGERPNRSDYRLVIIDGGELLTKEAQNALLKISEDPPASAVLIIVVRDPELIQSTLASRFQKIYFAPLKNSEVEKCLLDKGVNSKLVKEVASRSFGKIGLAMKFIDDDNFKNNIELGQKLINADGRVRRQIIKELVSSEDFMFSNFLDVLLIIVAGNKKKIDFDFWHRLLNLKKQASYFTLNPRIQLSALFN